MDRNSRPRGAGNTASKATAQIAGQKADVLAKKELHLDGIVILKIVKHADESADTMGVLLGLDQAAVATTAAGPKQVSHLEVTNCFPLLPPESANERRQDKYMQEMLKLLREVKIDNYNIGWYMSCPLHAFCTERFVQIQYKYQEETAGAAAIIYDPSSTSLGSLYIKAFRLSDKFMEFMARGNGGGGRLTSEKVAQFKLTHANLLEEIPIKIHNGQLTRALLCELAKQDDGATAFEKLDLSVNPFLEKHVEVLQDEVDDMIGEMAKLHDYLKGAQLVKQKRMKWIQERKATNRERKKSGLEPLPEDDASLDSKTPPAPSRLNALLVTKQISSYCDQINSYMANSKIKLDVARTFQDNK